MYSRDYDTPALFRVAFTIFLQSSQTQNNQSTNTVYYILTTIIAYFFNESFLTRIMRLSALNQLSLVDRLLRYS